VFKLFFHNVIPEEGRVLKILLPATSVCHIREKPSTFVNKGIVIDPAVAVMMSLSGP